MSLLRASYWNTGSLSELWKLSAALVRYFGDEALPPISSVIQWVSAVTGGNYVKFCIMASAQYSIRSIVQVDISNHDMAKDSKRKSKFVFYL